MKQEAITITTAIFAGAVAKGATGYFLADKSNNVQMGVNALGALGFGFLAIKTKGNDTKASIIRGGALGSCLAHGLGAIKNVFSTEAGLKLVGDSKVMKSLAGLGLNAPETTGGAQGFLDDYGNYSEDGWDGYVDPAGNYVMYENAGMNAYAEDLQYLGEAGTIINHAGAMVL